MIRTIPPLALIPLVILWFGIDESAKLFLVAFGTLFPVYINTYHGIRSVDPGLVEMARSYGQRGWPLFRDVILPGALPSILVGVRFALGFAWILLIVAETISASSGIGYLATNAREFLQTDVVVLSILLYALLGKRPTWWRACWNGAGCAGIRLIRMYEEAAMNAPLATTATRGVALDVRAVSKQFGERTVLDQLDLRLDRGEFVALVGRSGCGKSTLLRLIAGLESASSGDITADGKPHAQAQAQTRMMFQDARLLPWKTVLQNVGLGLPGDWKAAALNALAEVGLEEHAQKMASATIGRTTPTCGAGARADPCATPVVAGRTAGRAGCAHPHRNAPADRTRVAKTWLYRAAGDARCARSGGAGRSRHPDRKRPDRP